MKTKQPRLSDLVRKVQPAVRALEGTFGKQEMKTWTAAQKRQIFAAMSSLIRLPTGRRADPEISKAIALRKPGTTMRQIARQILPDFRYETPREQTYMVERLRKRVSNRLRYERNKGSKVSNPNTDAEL
jgi:hypothetical protein